MRVALDPFGDIGYPLPDVAADIVTVSHEHGDHNDADGVAGSPVILRGLKAGGADWNSISYGMKDVRITSLPAQTWLSMKRCVSAVRSSVPTWT